MFDDFTYVQIGEEGARTNVSILSAEPRVVDWNNNGKPDLVIGGDDGSVYLLLNVGTADNPRFSAAKALLDGEDILTVEDRASPAVADWTGNGKKDLLVGAFDGHVYLYENRGTDADPTFRGRRRLPLQANVEEDLLYSRPAVADWNQDGIPDLLVGYHNGQVFVYMSQEASTSVFHRREGHYERMAE